MQEQMVNLLNNNRCIMKNFILVFGLMFALLFSSAFAQEKAIPVKKKAEVNQPKQETLKKVEPKKTEQKKDKKAAKPTKGTVIDLNDWLKGGAGKVSKDQALKLAENGSPIVLMVGSGKSAKIYFVVNTDGSFAGKNLAKYANNKFIGVTGKTKKVGGMNVIVADMIESMD
jgi:hypothetical protein